MIGITDLKFAHPGGGFHLAIPSLTVERGARAAVVGPSGTGKTTLLNLISGILPADSGRIEVDGTPMTGLTDAARRAQRIRKIGFVFQNFELVEYLSAGENILYPYRITDSLRLTSKVRQRADLLAGAVGLTDKLHRKPAALSQGEQQRIAICRALIAGPPVILADEPTGNLDPDNKALILDLLFDQATAHGATLLVVTHDHELLPRFDQVIDFAEYRSTT